MTYALVIAQDPGPDADQGVQQRWLGLLNATANTVATNTGIRTLSASSWLFHLDNGLPAFLILQRQCNGARFPCHTIFLDKEPVVITT